MYQLILARPLPQILKAVLIISLFFICTSSHGQLAKYTGTWISAEQDCMVINDTTNKYDNSNMLCSSIRDGGMALYIYGDTLSFQKKYYSSATNYKKLYTDRYDLKIMKYSDSFLITRPVSTFSKDFFKNRKEIRFIRQKYAVDTSIKLEKIIFHTSVCFGTCDIYHLEVDKSGSLKLHRELVYGKTNSFTSDTSVQGYFTGRVNDSSFHKLNKALQTCNLQTLRMNNITCCDGSVITMIIYFNGQRRYFKSMIPPVISHELINTLYEICSDETLKKIPGKFKIEE